MRLEKKPVNGTSFKGIARRNVDPIKEDNSHSLKVNANDLTEIHACVRERLKVLLILI